MTAIAFPAPYELDVGMSFEWVDGFEYSPAMKQELREKFPEWSDLHKAVEMNDTVIPWNLLEAYQRRFVGISLNDIINLLKTPTFIKNWLSVQNRFSLWVSSLKTSRNVIFRKVFSTR